MLCAAYYNSLKCSGSRLKKGVGIVGHTNMGYLDDSRKWKKA